MGKVARFACILVPMLLTLVSLICGVVLLLSGTNNIKGLHSYYQLKINTKNLVLSDTIDLVPGSRLDPKIKTGFSISSDKTDFKIKDFYNSYMFNYCSGDIEEDDGVKSDKITYCKPSKVEYVFDLEKIIQENTDEKIEFPDAVHRAQKTLNIVSRFMVACYSLAILCTGVTFLIGWFGLLSRLGSCITTIFATVAFGFFFVASSCSTGLSYSLNGALNKAFKDFQVQVTVGKHWLTATWCATAFAFCAALFWLLSSCCCSGRTSKVMGEKHKNSKTVKVEHTPYTYERVASPYPTGSVSSVPLKPYGKETKEIKETKAYEPMRHHSNV